MAITLSTTLAVACGRDDRTIKLTSGTSAAVGMVVKMEQEWSKVAAIASDGVTITLGLRGDQGSIATPHKILSPVEISAAGDFADGPYGTTLAVPYSTPLVQWYGAAGAITIPEKDANIFLVAGTAAAMTLVAPSTDIDGRTLTIMAAAAQAYTVTVPTSTGIKNTAGTATFGGAIADNVVLIACKGQWNPVSVIGVTFA